MLELYKNIKNERLKNGWNQSELAKRVGYSDKSMIAKIEAGKVDLPQTKIRAFAQVFNVTESYLMGWEFTSEESTKALEYIINTNNDKGGSSKFAQFLYDQTVKKPAANDFTDEEIELIKKFRQADASTKDVIVRLLSFAVEQEKKNDNR